MLRPSQKAGALHAPASSKLALWRGQAFIIVKQKPKYQVTTWAKNKQHEPASLSTLWNASSWCISSTSHGTTSIQYAPSSLRSLIPSVPPPGGMPPGPYPPGPFPLPGGVPLPHIPPNMPMPPGPGPSGPTVLASAPRSYSADYAMTQKLILAGLQGKFVSVWVGKVSPILEDSMVKRLLEVCAPFSQRCDLSIHTQRSHS